MDKRVERISEKMLDSHTYSHTCDTCRHYLGGGCCRINLEAECGAGEFEAWEPKEEKEDE